MGYKSSNSPILRQSSTPAVQRTKFAVNLELARNEKLTPQRLRQQLQEEHSSDLKWRRGIIGLSLVGMANMTAVTLLQSGIIKHLPDSPFGNFDSDRVNSSDTAYRLGAPDNSISLASLAATFRLRRRSRADQSLGSARGSSESGG
jgi:hypothetical protein